MMRAERHDREEHTERERDRDRKDYPSRRDVLDKVLAAEINYVSGWDGAGRLSEWQVNQVRRRLEKKLADVDLAVLEELVAIGWGTMQRVFPEG